MDEKETAIKSAIDTEKLSLTLKALAGALLPILHLFTGVTFVSEDVDKVIDASILLIATGTAVYGYLRTKLALQRQVKSLGGQLGSTRNFQ